MEGCHLEQTQKNPPKQVGFIFGWVVILPLDGKQLLGA